MKFYVKHNRDGTATLQARVKVGKKDYRGKMVLLDWPPTETAFEEAAVESSTIFPFKPQRLQDWANKRGTE